MSNSGNFSSASVSQQKNEPSLFEGIIGILTQPHATIAELFESGTPRHILPLFLICALTLATPIALRHHFAPNAESLNTALAALAGGSSVFITFTLATYFFLVLVGTQTTFLQNLACSIYALIPLALSFALTLFFNYLTEGSITILDAIYVDPSAYAHNFLRIVPIAIVVASLYTFYVYFAALRTMLELDIVGGLVLSLFCLIPFGVACYIGIMAADAIHPGLVSRLVELSSLPVALLQRIRFFM